MAYNFNGTNEDFEQLKVTLAFEKELLCLDFVTPHGNDRWSFGNDNGSVQIEDKLNKNKRDIPPGFVPTYKAQVQKLVQRNAFQIWSKQFLLIPLIFGIKEHNGNWKAYSSLLIKFQKSDKGDNYYINLNGRIYQSFKDFLDFNKFPVSVLCYPDGGVVQLDDKNQPVLISRVVGVKNVLLSATDAAVAAFGIFGAFALPSTSIVISAYFVIRGTLQLCDYKHHEKSLNPVLDLAVLIHWFQIFGNMMIFAIESFQLSNLFGNYISIAEKQAFLNLFTIMCATTQNHLNWCNLALNQQVSFRTAMCFAYRKLISMEYTRSLSFRVILDILYKLFTESMQRSFYFNLFVVMWTTCFENVRNLLGPCCDLILIYPLFFGVLLMFMYSLSIKFDF